MRELPGFQNFVKQNRNGSTEMVWAEATGVERGAHHFPVHLPPHLYVKRILVLVMVVST